MSLKAHSPCDCSIIPMSPGEADEVFVNQDRDLRAAIEKARRNGSVLCPSCTRTFSM